MSLPELHGYQERAIKQSLEENRFQAIGMGLGKTRIALEIKHRTNLKLWVCAPLLVAQYSWPKEILKWFPNMSFVLVHGAGKAQYMRYPCDIKLINYEGLKWLVDYGTKHGIRGMQGQMLVLDESTDIKDPSTARFKNLRKILPLFERVYCMSATPRPNGIKNLWSQYYALDSGKRLGRTYSAFRKEFLYESGPPRWVVESRPGAEEEIQKRIKPITSVLETEDYLTLPPITYNTYTVDLPKETMGVYKQFKKDFVAEVGEEIVKAVNSGVQSMKLRQIVQGAVYNADRTYYEVLHMEKLQALKAILAQCEGEQVICAIQFRFELEMIKAELKYDVPTIAGGVSDSTKTEILRKWDSGNMPLLLVHPAALSRGLNMQEKGRTIIWYGLTWNLEQYEQLNGRVFRQGQMLPVYINHIAARHTIDEKIALALSTKGLTQSEFMRAIKEALVSE